MENNEKYQNLSPEQKKAVETALENLENNTPQLKEIVEDKNVSLDKAREALSIKREEETSEASHSIEDVQKVEKEDEEYINDKVHNATEDIDELQRLNQKVLELAQAEEELTQKMKNSLK
jgi:uncharacterized Ntn-hydrolase superfamily protein